MNGDGFDDLLIGAASADASRNTKSTAGDSYVIFGGASPPTTIDLASLGTAGITIFGADADDGSGISVSSAGDVNGDGFDDLLIGARNADASGNAKSSAGNSYVIFGRSSLPETIDLASLGTAGITIFGADADDGSGISVSSAGDVNGDGFDDLLIGAYLADASGNTKSLAGDSYVIFGGASLPETIDLASLGSAGITIFGADAGDRSGRSVSSAGDVNGDGFDDLLIGARYADASGNAKSSAGDSYVIFGGATLPTTIDLASLGTAGIMIFGADANDGSGRSVSSAGDVNGDGFDDLLIGARFADASGNAKLTAGESYVIFGADFTAAVTHQGTTAGETLMGTGTADVMVGGQGDDTLVGSGGADVLTGGQGNDILAVSDLAFNRIVGGTGTDTLRLDGSGLWLDLTTLRDNRLLGIEQIDLTGSGNNTLTLTPRDVLNISDESNTLVIRRNSGDTVNIGIGWTQGSDEVIGLDTFHVYTQGAATLKVQNIVPVIGAFDTTVAYTANAPAEVIDLNAMVTDGGTTQFNGSVLTVSLTANAEASDRLELREVTRLISVSGANVLYRGTIVGTFAGGAGATNRVITFNSNATESAVQTVLRNVTYHSVSANPSPATRTVQMTFTDSTGGTSNQPTKTIAVAGGSGIAAPDSVAPDSIAPSTHSEPAVDGPVVGTPPAVPVVTTMWLSTGTSDAITRVPVAGDLTTPVVIRALTEWVLTAAGASPGDNLTASTGLTDSADLTGNCPPPRPFAIPCMIPAASSHQGQAIIEQSLPGSAVDAVFTRFESWF